MSAVQILMVVGSCVQTPLAPTHVAAVLVTPSVLTDTPAMVRSKVDIFYNNILNYYSDINECSGGSHGCSQICTNTIGSYTCSCNSGYRLGSNGRTCIGNCMD